MHIVHVAPFIWPHLGGVETHVMMLARLLVKEGHVVSIIATQHDPTLPLQETHAGINLYRIPAKATHSKRQTWQAIAEHREVFAQADIVHVHDVFWWLIPVYPLIARKVYMTFHGWEGVYPVSPTAKLHRYLASALTKKHIHVGDWIKLFYWDKPDAVTYGGVTLAPHSPSFVEHMANKGLKFVFVGRLSPENEVTKYQELLALLNEHGINYTMAWVGEGPLRASCEQWGEVTGFIEDYASYLSSASFVFSSSYLSILSAQERGKIVCSFYSHPLKKAYLETFPGKSWMIITKSPEKMLKNINILLKNPKKMLEMRKKSYNFAKTQTWNNVLSLYERLWK